MSLDGSKSVENTRGVRDVAMGCSTPSFARFLVLMTKGFEETRNLTWTYEELGYRYM